MKSETVYEKFVTAIFGKALFFLIFGLIITPLVAWLGGSPQFRSCAISSNVRLAFAPLTASCVGSHQLHYIPRREDLIFAAVVGVGAVVAQYFLKPQSGPIAAAPVSGSGVLETTGKALQNGALPGLQRLSGAAIHPDGAARLTVRCARLESD